MASSFENALVALRTQANNEIDRRGGKAKAPSWAAILEDIDAQLSAFRAGKPLPQAATNNVKNIVNSNAGAIAQYNQKIAQASMPSSAPVQTPQPAPVQPSMTNLAAAAAQTAAPQPTVTPAPAVTPVAPTSTSSSFSSMSEQDLMNERKQVLAEIERRGGKANAPNFAAKLEQIDTALSAMRKGAPTQESAPASSPISSLADAAASASQTTEEPQGYSVDGKSEQELMDERKRTLAEIERRGGKAAAPNYAKRLEQIDGALSTMRKAAGVTGAPTEDRPAIQTGGNSTSAVDPGTSTGSTNTTINTGGSSPLIPDNISSVIDPKSGTVDLGNAADVLEKTKEQDINTQFKLDQPIRMTDQYGNVRVIKRDPTTGEVTITDELGGSGKTFKDLATAAASNWNPQTGRKEAEEAAYGTITKYYDRDKERELEAAKQEMANRGIPYNPAAAFDPNSNDLYGRTIGAVGERYQSLKDDAQRQAILAGNQAYATNTAAQQAFLNAVMQGANQFSGSWQPYQNKIDASLTDETLDLMKLSADAYMTKYGIDQDTYIKKKQIAAQKSSGGGSGGGGGSSGAGFEIAY